MVLANLPVEAVETSLEEAKSAGAMALFGEKYGERVRMVSMGDFSRELCGGTHVRSTGEVGLFKLLSESGIGAGLRRIEAVTGAGTLGHLRSREAALEEAAAALKTQIDDVPAKVKDLLKQLKEREREIEALQGKLAKSELDGLFANAIHVDGVRIIAGRAPVNDMDSLRSMADLVRDKLGSGVVVLGAASGEKVNFVAMVTKDLIPRGLHAGNIIREVAAAAGGGGGGRPDMAQAGGKDPTKLDAALARVEHVVRGQLGR